MTVAQTRQTVRDWITNLRQSTQPPAAKLAEVQQRKRDKTDQLQKVLASSEQAILEKELADLAAEEVALRPAVAQAKLVAYQEAEREWESGEEMFRREIGADLLAMQAKLDKWSEHCAQRPRPPAGAPPVYFSNDHEIFGARDGLVRAGEAIGKFEQAGTGDAPRLQLRSDTVQIWGVPEGLRKGK